MSTFARLLDALDRDPGERLSISLKDGSGFRSKIVTVGEAPGIAAGLTEVDAWFGTAVLHERVGEGRGTAADVIGVRELWADLDAKAGGVHSLDVAHKVSNDLSRMLGVAPAAMVMSGHGLQPHWQLERGEDTDWPDENDPRHQRATVLFRRWGRLVAHVAEVHGGQVDHVWDLSRVLRIPGTLNCKSAPVPVTAEFTGGGAVSLDRLADTLDEYAVPEQPGDAASLGVEVAPPAGWAYAEVTCPYVASMIAGWATDRPGTSGRHPWLVAQTVRLAAAHRAGCLTHTDHQSAAAALTVAFRGMLDDRHEGRGEVADALTWGQAKVASFPDQHRVLAELGGHTHTPAVTTLDADDDEAFWTARPILQHIHTFARARRCSPWAVLAAVAVRVVCQVPPRHTLPAIIGGPASLNVFVGIVAASGGGKGAAEAAALDAVITAPVHTVGLGSGEGLLHTFAMYVKKAGTPGRIEQHRTSALFTLGEVDTLVALKGRQGSTLLPELRKIYMGEELSFGYVDPTKALRVERHRYRAGLIVGVQPARAGVLLDDAAGGTPQRFMWVPGADPGMPDVAPDEPAPVQWTPPADMPATLPVCGTARRLIEDEHVKRNRGAGDALDGHALLTRLKWAAALALLDGRAEVTDADWHLAGQLMALSTHTRDSVQATLAEQWRATNVARGEADAERAVITEARREDANVTRVCKTVVRKLAAAQGWMTRGALYRALTSADRQVFDAAADRLAGAGQIDVEDGPRGGRYRLTDGAP